MMQPHMLTCCRKCGRLSTSCRRPKNSLRMMSSTTEHTVKLSCAGRVQLGSRKKKESLGPRNIFHLTLGFRTRLKGLRSSL
jgi:hypothetical protein